MTDLCVVCSQPVEGSTDCLCSTCWSRALPARCVCGRTVWHDEVGNDIPCPQCHATRFLSCIRTAGKARAAAMEVVA